ncbi:hypothetical protein [Phyllobacterium sp. A18/5-2]|uniref:hypothetical protein n=1 Tax=Phyllobacterium sp. A18/5-2 TaxID=2978392 RepID=UPI0029056234|nr:hypothetical protein [Phyllobacterium sp. A18/5-2]
MQKITSIAFFSQAEVHSLGPYLAVGRGFKGELAIRRGDASSTVDGLQRCLTELHAAPYKLLSTPLNIALVQGFAATGRYAEAFALIEKTIRMVEATGELCYLPELLRVNGSLVVAAPRLATDEAELYFKRALELSRRQGARAWELRTATELANLLATRGQRESARVLLQPVFEWFAEGLETADLKSAARLLAMLNQ